MKNWRPLDAKWVMQIIPRTVVERRRNRLLSSMIERVNARLAWSLARPIDGRSVDPRAIYDSYCMHRTPPPLVAIDASRRISIGIYGEEDAPCFVGLFVWPWGLWICAVDPSLDRHGVNRAILLDRLNAIALRHTALSCCTPGVQRLLRRITEKCGDGDTCWPRILPIHSQGDAAISAIEALAWEKYGIDAVSWTVARDYKRLWERPPKNPIDASFVAAWRLRWEQMAKIGCDLFLCAALGVGAMADGCQSDRIP
jgi:hypothetical protein